MSSIKILRENERGVIFRLGRVLPKPKGPGIILVFAPVDPMVRISLRIDTLEVPAQDIVTHDNVTVKVNAVVLFSVIDARLAVLEVNNFLYATSPCQNSMEIIKYRLIGGWRRVLCCRSDLE